MFAIIFLILFISFSNYFLFLHKNMILQISIAVNTLSAMLFLICDFKPLQIGQKTKGHPWHNPLFHNRGQKTGSRLVFLINGINRIKDFF